MNTETNEKVLRALGWQQWLASDGGDPRSEGMWYRGKKPTTVLGLHIDAPQAHEDPATVLAALEYMGEHSCWLYWPEMTRWVKIDLNDDWSSKSGYNTTHAEAIIAGFVAWCEQDNWSVLDE